jgi:hypothetical protein
MNICIVLKKCNLLKINIFCITKKISKNILPEIIQEIAKNRAALQLNFKKVKKFIRRVGKSTTT